MNNLHPTTTSATIYLVILAILGLVSVGGLAVAVSHRTNDDRDNDAL